jgi:DNA polymerase delta subunit 1
LRTLSFDIECCGRKGIFPVPEEDPVIQIANLVVDQMGSVIAKNIFTLNSCAPITGSDVFSFEDEKDLLKAWKDFFVECDPDIITGYNIVGFDIPYLIDRAVALSIDAFPYLGRIKNKKSIVKKSTFSSAQV